MKTSIQITGSGISSKTTLLGSIANRKSETKNLMFNNYEVVFPTKKEAIKALSDAYQTLSSDKEDWRASMGSYTRGSSLSYDAGVASIIDPNV